MNNFLKLFTCFYLGLNGICLANTSTGIDPSSNFENSKVTDPCYEPAPTNFHITDVFTDEIRVAWDVPANQPFEYNIMVFETSNGNLVQNFNIPGNLTIARAVNLQPNKQYTIRNTPVCPDGVLSSYHVDGTGSTLIIELVANGFTPSNSIATCTMRSGGDFCNYNPPVGNIVTFKVCHRQNQNYGRYFGIYNSDYMCPSTKIKVHPANTMFQFYCDNSSQSPDCLAEKVIITHNGTPIAEFSIGDPVATFSYIYCTANANSNYEIIRIGTINGAYDSGGGECNYIEEEGEWQPGKPKARFEDDWEDITAPQNLLVSPNPFSEHLDIKIPFANPNENTTITLYDLQGRRLKHLQMPGAQQTFQLSTLDLASGMYFLRAESGAVSETVKIIKTE